MHVYCWDPPLDEADTENPGLLLLHILVGVAHSDQDNTAADDDDGEAGEVHTDKVEDSNGAEAACNTQDKADSARSRGEAEVGTH